MLKSFRLTILVSIIILILSLISLNSVPKVSFKASDKIGHFLAYACLSFVTLVELAKHFRWSKQTSRLLIRSLPFCVGYGILMEFLQASPISNRHFEIADMVANTLGALAGGLLFMVLNQWLKDRLLRKK